MEFKHLFNKYVYRIEPRPGGGFIARATDPSVPPLEAATREELREKVQATVLAGLNQEFPGLTLPLKGDGKQFAFHVERNAQGEFDIHTSLDASASPKTAATHDDVESHFAEKLIALVGKHFAPELAQALATPGATRDIKVFVKGTGFTVTAGGNSEAGINPLALPTAADAEAAHAGGSLAGSYSSDDGPISRQPIPPGNERWSAVVRFLAALLIVAALMYFFFLRQHH